MMIKMKFNLDQVHLKDKYLNVQPRNSIFFSHEKLKTYRMPQYLDEEYEFVFLLIL